MVAASTSNSVVPPACDMSGPPSFTRTMPQAPLLSYIALALPLLPARRLSRLRLLEDGLKHAWRRHRHVVQACPSRRCNGVGDSRERWHDRRLANAAHTIWMAGVRRLDDHCIDHRHVRRDGDSVVEEPRILEPAIRAVDIFLVERPSDTLHGATLHLTLDVAWMHRLARVLHDRIAQDLDRTRLGIDLDVADVGAETHAGTVGVVLEMASNRPAGARELLRNLLEREWLELACVGPGGLRRSVLPDDSVGWNAPDRRRTCAEHLDSIARGVDHADAGGKGHPAAVGDVVVAEGGGVGNDGAHAVIGDAQLFGHHHAHRGA